MPSGVQWWRMACSWPSLPWWAFFYRLAPPSISSSGHGGARLRAFLTGRDIGLDSILALSFSE
eukprot:8246135-Pyramimonas_sp.AAC.1